MDESISGQSTIVFHLHPNKKKRCMDFEPAHMKGTNAFWSLFGASGYICYVILIRILLFLGRVSVIRYFGRLFHGHNIKFYVL